MKLKLQNLVTSRYIDKSTIIQGNGKKNDLYLSEHYTTSNNKKYK